MCTQPHVFVVVMFVALSAPAISAGDDAPRPAGRAAKPTTGIGVGRLEARLSDGSILKLTLLDSHLRLKTQYGELRIPVIDLRRVEFATRIDDEVAQQISAAIVELGNDDYDVRERAMEKLSGFGGLAYPALLQAVESTDLEVVHRAEKLVSAVRESLPADQYEVRADDVILTAKSKFAGQIEAASLLVATEPFGKQELRLTHLRSLRSAAAGQQEATAALPDPGSLSNYQGQAGKTFRFRVTGGMPMGQFGARGGFVGGAVWGSDIYTLDSTLAIAAVHAGVLQSGESGIVTVTILGPQNSFEGSTRNGITTSSWAQFPGGFKFTSDEDLP